VIFGDEDILINNVAWLLRRFPVFVVPGSGEYKLQPIFVEDMADIVVNVGKLGDNMTLDAVGPEVFTFNELVRLIASTIRSRAKIVHLPARLALASSRLIGYATRDVLLTRDEVDGLSSNLLVSHHPPTGDTRLSEWLQDHAGTIGIRYASELDRHYR
jgi:NADH dehydrogenase